MGTTYFVEFPESSILRLKCRWITIDVELAKRVLIIFFCSCVCDNVSRIRLLAISCLGILHHWLKHCDDRRMQADYAYITKNVKSHESECNHFTSQSGGNSHQWSHKQIEIHLLTVSCRVLAEYPLIIESNKYTVTISL